MLQSFAPIIANNPKILILGTMPGEASLKLQQYYGFPQNAFWRILFEVYQIPFSEDYQERTKLILTQHLALWDVLQYCKREGSLDSAIKEEVPNVIGELLRQNTTIHKILFNGQKAKAYFDKYIKNTELELCVLPSTSPANASMKFDEKFELWKAAIINKTPANDC